MTVNIAAGARRINMYSIFTNRKVPFIQYPEEGSKATEKG